MSNKSDRQIMRDELPFSSGREDYSDEIPTISRERSRPRRRTARDMGKHLKSDGRKVFKAIDEAYKIPDKITKGLNDFCKSLGKSFGGK